MLVQQFLAAAQHQAHYQLLKVNAEINARHDIVVNILINNIPKQRGLVSKEQNWDDMKMAKTTRDEITIGTEHWRSDDWKEKGWVQGAKLKPDLVWLRRDSGDKWRKVVVGVKITSTEDMGKAFEKRRQIPRVDFPGETREKNVAMAVTVPLIISHDGAVHKDSIRRWKVFAKISKSTGSEWHRLYSATML